MNIKKINFSGNTQQNISANVTSLPNNNGPVYANATNNTQVDKISLDKKVAIAGIGVSAIAIAILFRKNIQGVIKTLFKKTNKIQKPKFLYHMTSEDAYQSILNDGKIKTSSFSNGVFMSDLQNLKSKYPENSLIRMINFYDGGNWTNRSPHRHTGKVIMLKIPTNELDQNLLGFRRIKLSGENNIDISDEIVKFKDYSSESSRDIIDKPLEFIYQKEIPTSKIAKVYKLDTEGLYRGDSTYLENVFNKLRK